MADTPPFAPKRPIGQVPSRMRSRPMTVRLRTESQRLSLIVAARREGLEANEVIRRLVAGFLRGDLKIPM